MKKTKRFAGGGGSGRSSYQGNENSYTQDSDMDASDSVGKGALSRRLAAAAAAREAADMEPTPSRASRDFDAVEAASSMDDMEAANQRENLSPVGPRAMPTRPGQGRMAPIVAPTRRRGLDMAPSAPSDRSESRSARDVIAKLEAASGRAKVREQDARMSAPSAPASPVDETKLPLSERIKLSRERAGKGSGPTDTRSVNDRFKAMFGMKKGGAVKMASGGSVSSASRRADGIAQKGKTRGKMC
jgi:hypothetical protein